MRSTMAVCWVVSFLALAYKPKAEQPESSAKPAPADLVPCLAGSPVSVQQIDERVPALVGGTPKGTVHSESGADITRSMIYRDSAGRLRIESSGEQGDPPIAILVDPITGSRVFLSAADETAYRIIGPKAGESGFSHGVGGMGEALPAGAWNTTTEKLGQRSIDGIDAGGQRITQICADQPSLVAVCDRWYSSQLKLTVLAEASGPYGTHTARIQILGTGEPDRVLFAVPPHYNVVEMEGSNQRHPLVEMKEES
jgi:hypothetical protein